MTTPQRPIGSGFDAKSTAEEVLDGLDLDGRIAVLTGGYSGLGLEATRALTRAGVKVIVPARRREAAEAALAGVAGVEVDELDLGDLESVAAFADRILASGRSIDFMIDNAGVMAVAERTLLGPGWEMQFATNHLGHFALVNRLWPAIAADGGGRVVSVSSRGHHRSPVRWDDPHFEHTSYDKWEAYGQAKTSNVLFAVELDKLGQDAGVRAFALHPGGIMTPLQRHLAKEEMVAAGWIDEDGNVKNPNFKTPEQGAATEVWCATSPQLDGMGGVYCEDCDIAEMAQEGDTSQGVRDYAVDPAQAERLWTLSAELTGVNAFSATA